MSGIRISFLIWRTKQKIRLATWLHKSIEANMNTVLTELGYEVEPERIFGSPRVAAVTSFSIIILLNLFS
jgi:hypothetical protein